MQCVGILLGSIGLTLCVLEPELLPRVPRWILVTPVLLVVLCLAQLIPLPDTMLVGLIGPVHELRNSVLTWQGAGGVIPHSISSVPGESLDALLRLLAYCGIGFAVTVGFRRRSHLRLLAWAICSSATFQAFYGSYELLSGRQHIFGYVKQYYLEDASGTFVNRNHFANFLAISLPFVWFLLLETLPSRTSHTDWRQRLLAWTRRETLSRWGLVVCLAVIYLGLVLSNSRAGLLAGGLATVLVLLAVRRHRVVVTMALLVLCLPVAYLATREELSAGERFEQLESDLQSPSGRLTVWKASTGIVVDAPAVRLRGRQFRVGVSALPPGDDSDPLGSCP